MEDKQRRMGELVALLNRAAYAYYTKDEPIMADVQYDRLYDELLSLEKETGVQNFLHANFCSSYSGRIYI